MRRFSIGYFYPQIGAPLHLDKTGRDGVGISNKLLIALIKVTDLFHNETVS